MTDATNGSLDPATSQPETASESTAGDNKESTRRAVTRRRFLMGLAGTGAATATSMYLVRDTSGGSPTSLFDNNLDTQRMLSVDGGLPAPTTLTPADLSASDILRPAPVEDRVLVLIELQGGNDGASTIVPYGDGKYYDLRPNLSIAQDQVIPIDDQVGLAPNLASLSERQFAVVEGVGNTLGSLSHFDQQEQWHLAGGNRVGFVSQLGAELGETYGTDGLVTLSVAGYAPQLNGAGTGTLTISRANQVQGLVRDDFIYPAYKKAVRSFSGGPLTAQLARSYSRMYALGDSIPGDFQVDKEQRMIAEGKSLGEQLWTAAGMIEGGSGVRVIHAKLGGFDTHQGHKNKHDQLMTQVDAAVDGFLDRMERAGLSDRVLVALTSEFGRRATENGNGLDHGNGSTLMVFGPVNPGRHGVYNSFGNLDDRGNFKTQIPYTTYLRTLAHDWLGAESVLADAESIDGLI